MLVNHGRAQIGMAQNIPDQRRVFGLCHGVDQANAGAPMMLRA
jgi:hypothetical protein